MYGNTHKESRLSGELMKFRAACRAEVIELFFRRRDSLLAVWVPARFAAGDVIKYVGDEGDGFRNPED